MTADVVVVGASAGGLAVVEGLRRGGFTGGIRWIGDEHHLPYDRPHLSKKFLSGEWSVQKSALRDALEIESLRTEMWLGRRAVALDSVARRLVLDDGSEVPFETLVIATGVSPRRMTISGLQGMTHVLYNRDDATQLKNDLKGAKSIAVIGGGTLGCEIAATIRGMGKAVTVISRNGVLMEKRVGHEVGEFLTKEHLEQGVEVLRQSDPSQIERLNDGSTKIHMSDGAIVCADIVISAIGSAPNTRWLVGSGLNVSDGVLCDAYCAAAPGIYAVGDVSRWDHQKFGTVRLENRTNAVEQGMAVAANILGANRVYSPLPYFWSDQYGNRLQVFGFVPPVIDGIEYLEGSLGASRFVGLIKSNGTPTAVFGWNHPKAAKAASRGRLWN